MKYHGFYGPVFHIDGFDLSQNRTEENRIYSTKTDNQFNRHADDKIHKTQPTRSTNGDRSSYIRRITRVKLREKYAGVNFTRYK